VPARVPGDSAVVKKKKGRVLDVKAVAQLNSVRVSFMNRKENEDSLAKAPAAHGLRHGVHSVGRVRTPLRGPRRVLRMSAGGTLGWAEPSLVGHAMNSFSNFPM
jgi:hypothetical protein